MASTSKSDSPETVSDRSAAIQQERAETQNTLIVRYMQIEETKKLYLESQNDESVPVSPVESRLEADNDSQVTIKAPSDHEINLSLVRIPLSSLGEVDQMLENMGNSSKDMVRVSAQAIDPLLEKWTRWRDVREQRHTRQPFSRYTPTVHSLYENDQPYYERYDEREDSPRGYFLEGATTDWRRPNSAIARQEYVHRKKQYAGYQASVSGHSSDQEESPVSNASGKRGTRRHVINSSSDSDSEPEAQKKTVSLQPGPPLNKSATTPACPPGNLVQPRMPPSPAQSISSKPPTTPQYAPSLNNRPYTTPDQNGMYHHSISMPLPPIYTHNAPNPYAQGSPQSPAYGHSPYYNQYPTPAPALPRQVMPNSNRMAAPRPMSRDGKGGGRSPSRLSQEMPKDLEAEKYYDRERPRDRDRDRDRERDRYSYRDRDVDRYHDGPRSDKRPRESKSKLLREGATKGLLGAGAIGLFLEALEGI